MDRNGVSQLAVVGKHLPIPIGDTPTLSILDRHMPDLQLSAVQYGQSCRLTDSLDRVQILTHSFDQTDQVQIVRFLVQLLGVYFPYNHQISMTECVIRLFGDCGMLTTEVG